MSSEFLKQLYFTQYTDSPMNIEEYKDNMWKFLYSFEIDDIKLWNRKMNFHLCMPKFKFDKSLERALAKAQNNSNTLEFLPWVWPVCWLD